MARTHASKLAKGRKTQLLTKLSGLINGETHRGFFKSVTTVGNELQVTVQSSNKRGESTFTLHITEKQP